MQYIELITTLHSWKANNWWHTRSTEIDGNKMTCNGNVRLGDKTSAFVLVSSHWRIHLNIITLRGKCKWK